MLGGEGLHSDQKMSDSACSAGVMRAMMERHYTINSPSILISNNQYHVYHVTSIQTKKTKRKLILTTGMLFAN